MECVCAPSCVYNAYELSCNHFSKPMTATRCSMLAKSSLASLFDLQDDPPTLLSRYVSDAPPTDR